MKTSILKGMAAFLFCALLIACPQWAAATGIYDFSVDPDASLGGSVRDIYQVTSPGGTPAFDFNINAPPGGGASDQIDALSCDHRRYPDYHWVLLSDVISGTYRMLYSVENASDLRRWDASGSAIPGGARTLTYVGVHETEANLNLVGEDLDALETHYTVTPPGIDVPGPRQAWYNDNGMYLSVQGGTADDGDVFHRASDGTVALYLDDTIFIDTIFGAGASDEVQLDALIALDVSHTLDTFDQGTTLARSDMVLFSIAPNATYDTFGDNIYWWSAYDGGQGGLYADPGLVENVDALDMHNTPEPSTFVLMASLLLMGLGGRRMKRMFRSNSKS